jgi:hypothetical protein
VEAEEVDEEDLEDVPRRDAIKLHLIPRRQGNAVPSR